MCCQGLVDFFFVGRVILMYIMYKLIKISKNKTEIENSLVFTRNQVKGTFQRAFPFSKVVLKIKIRCGPDILLDGLNVAYQYRLVVFWLGYVLNLVLSKNQLTYAKFKHFN